MTLWARVAYTLPLLAYLALSDRLSAQTLIATWPQLKPVDTSFAVNQPNRKAYIRFPLADVAGRSPYTLFCRGGVEPYISEASPNPDNVVGPFACLLSEGPAENGSTLLATDESPSWYSEGQVHDYRELADPRRRRRIFRVRGFEFTMQFLNVGFKGDSLRRFDLRITVRPDKRITCRFAEGNPHPMCRNWSDSTRLGSWEPCANPC